MTSEMHKIIKLLSDKDGFFWEKEEEKDVK